MEYEEPQWLRRKLDRDQKALERGWKAEADARRRWQAWCPFCERDTEHAYADTGSRQDQNANVRCVGCSRLHAERAKRSQSN